jgi:hypothetical protein
MLRKGHGGGGDSKGLNVQELAKAKATYRLSLLAKPNVIGMGIGKRIRQANMTDETVVKVYVSRKLPKEILQKKDLIPSSLSYRGKDIPVDVEESTMPEAQIFSLRSRPIIGGNSIGPVSGGTGTLGICVSLDEKTTRAFILSNNHVLAGSNQLPIGTGIMQPGNID